MVTSDWIVFDDLPETNSYGGSFEYDNFARHAAIFVLVTSKGILRLTFSRRFLDNTIRPPKGGRKKGLPPATIAAYPSFEHYVGVLALGLPKKSQNTPKEPKFIKTFMNHLPKQTLNKFLARNKREGGTHVMLVTVTDPEDDWVKDNVAAIEWTIQTEVELQLGPDGSKLHTDLIKMNAEGSQKLGFYTHRDRFQGDVDAQYVAVLYGRLGGGTAMIPITSNANRELGCQDPENGEIELDKDQPRMPRGKWGDQPASWWFDSNLDTSPGDNSGTGNNKKITGLLVVTNHRWWLLALPPSYFGRQFISYVTEPKTVKQRIDNWKGFTETYLRNEANPDSFAAFQKSMAPDEKFVMYFTLAQPSQMETDPIANPDGKKWKYMDFLSPAWKTIDELAQEKKMSGLDSVQFIRAGRETKSAKTEFRMELSVDGAAKAVTVTYRQEAEFKVKLDPLGPEFPGIDGSDPEGEAIPLEKLVQESTVLTDDPCQSYDIWYLV